MAIPIPDSDYSDYTVYDKAGLVKMMQQRCVPEGAQVYLRVERDGRAPIEVPMTGFSIRFEDQTDHPPKLILTSTAEGTEFVSGRKVQ